MADPLRDLQWRQRRFLLAILGAGLVFAVTLLLAGLAAEFDDEAQRTVAGARADAWVVRAGVQGPFSTVSAFPSSTAAAVARLAGVRRADPVVVLHTSATASSTVDVVLFGFEPGAGEPGMCHRRGALQPA